MVVHNPEHQRQLVQQRAEQQKKVRNRKRKKLRWSVVGVQSLACVALLLLVFVLKLAGGSAYEGLKERFRGALSDNQLMAALSDLFREEKSDVKGFDFTDGETQQNQGVTEMNAAVLSWWPHV